MRWKLTNREHVQLLFYLLIVPEEKISARSVRGTSAEVPSPMSILNRMLDEYGPAVMGRYLPPEGREIVRSDGRLARSIERRFKHARSVWDLVLEKPERKRRRTTGTADSARKGKRKTEEDGEGRESQKSKGKGKAKAEEALEEEEEEEEEEVEEEEELEEPEKRVSDGGWVLLPWLTRLWAQDATSFERSLPQYTDLLDDASLPLLVIREALVPAPYLIKQQRGRVASSLLSLLVELASGPDPSFHPHSLVVSLVALLRRLDRDQLRALFVISDIDAAAEAHVLALALEERAGTRLKLSENRRKGTHAGFERGKWGPPTVKYALQLARDADELGATIATRLIADMGRIRADDDGWAEIDDDMLDDVTDNALRLALQGVKRRYDQKLV